jgi:hypothetical protein
MLGNGNGVNTAGDMETRIMLLRLFLRRVAKAKREDDVFLNTIIGKRVEICQALMTLFCFCEQMQVKSGILDFIESAKTAAYENRFDPMLNILRGAAIFATWIVFDVKADPFAAFDNSRMASSTYSAQVRAITLLKEAMARSGGGWSPATAVKFSDICFHSHEENDLMHITDTRSPFSAHSVSTSLGMSFANTPAGGLILRNRNNRWWVERA